MRTDYVAEKLKISSLKVFSFELASNFFILNYQIQLKN